MTFTYDLSSSDETELAISKVRLELGDTDSTMGVRPSGSNLTDEEISIWLSEEEDHVMRATARACEALARMWATVANTTIGPRKEELGKVSAEWAKQGKSLRDTYGGTTSSAFSVGVVREDGYSQATEATE